MTPNIDKQEMRNYLLGSLEAERQAALEESILCDPGIYEELLVIEDELIDEYITNNLSPSERQQFESKFLVTPERQRNLRFGRLLRRYVDSERDIDPDDIPITVFRQDEIHAPAHKPLPPGPDTFSRSVTLGVSAAVVVIVVILTFICWRTNRRQETVQQNVSTPVSYTLTPGSLRSEGAVVQPVKIPPKGVNLRLDLAVTRTNYRNYKAGLFRENQSVQTADELKVEPKGEQHVVPWTIAGEVLSPGDYKVTLTGVVDSGTDEFLDNYSFRVVKK